MPAKTHVIGKIELVDAIKSAMPKGTIDKKDTYQVGYKDGLKRALVIVGQQKVAT